MRLLWFFPEFQYTYLIRDNHDIIGSYLCVAAYHYMVESWAAVLLIARYCGLTANAFAGRLCVQFCCWSRGCLFCVQ